jgi:hypothetical protein
VLPSQIAPQIRQCVTEWSSPTRRAIGEGNMLSSQTGPQVLGDILLSQAAPHTSRYNQYVTEYGVISFI